MKQRNTHTHKKNQRNKQHTLSANIIIGLLLIAKVKETQLQWIHVLGGVGMRIYRFIMKIYRFTYENTFIGWTRGILHPHTG